MIVYENITLRVLGAPWQTPTDQRPCPLDVEIRGRWSETRHRDAAKYQEMGSLL